MAANLWPQASVFFKRFCAGHAHFCSFTFFSFPCKTNSSWKLNPFFNRRWAMSSPLGKPSFLPKKLQLNSLELRRERPPKNYWRSKLKLRHGKISPPKEELKKAAFVGDIPKIHHHRVIAVTSIFSHSLLIEGGSTRVKVQVSLPNYLIAA